MAHLGPRLGDTLERKPAIGDASRAFIESSGGGGGGGGGGGRRRRRRGAPSGHPPSSPLPVTAGSASYADLAAETANLLQKIRGGTATPKSRRAQLYEEVGAGGGKPSSTKASSSKHRKKGRRKKKRGAGKQHRAASAGAGAGDDGFDKRERRGSQTAIPGQRLRQQRASAEALPPRPVTISGGEQESLWSDAAVRGQRRTRPPAKPIQAFGSSPAMDPYASQQQQHQQQQPTGVEMLDSPEGTPRSIISEASDPGQGDGQGRAGLVRYMPGAVQTPGHMMNLTARRDATSPEADLYGPPR